MTFGGNASTSWGDDDFSQTFFFVIPEEHTSPIFIRVFDPDVGGEVDEINGYWDSKVSYTIYGGLKCYTDPDAQGVDPSGNYRSGNMLATRVFGENPRYDNDWFTFGPFNPTEGELVKKYGGYIFKIICEGAEGDDGNMYRYFVSTSGTENKRIEGANAFAYEYSFRMHNDPNEVSHIYPYIDDRTISVEQKNFDWDADGLIRVVSVARQGLLCVVSNDDAWAQNQFKILEEEIGTSLDFQFIKKNLKRDSFKIVCETCNPKFIECFPPKPSDDKKKSKVVLESASSGGDSVVSNSNVSPGEGLVGVGLK